MNKSTWHVGAAALLWALVGCESTPSTQSPPLPSALPSLAPSPSTTPSPISDGLSEGDGLGIGAPRFVESFSGASLDESRWRALKGTSGSLELKNGALRITAARSTSFPLLASIPAIIPANGPWAVEWGFTWKTFSDAVVFALDVFPPQGFDMPLFAQPFFLASPRNDFLYGRYPNGGEAFNTGVIFDGKAHRFRFEGDGDKAVRAYFDGKEINATSSNIRPLRFWVGSFPVANGGFRNWADLSLDYLVAGSLSESQSKRTPVAPSADPAASAEAASTGTKP